MKRILTVSLLVLTLIMSAAAVSAQDYVPSPGVLSPDQVDFGGAVITIIGTVDEDTFAEGTIREGRLEEAMELFNIGGIEFMFRPSSEVVMTRIVTGEATHDIIHRDWRNEYYSMAGHGMLLPLNDLLGDDYYDYLYPTDSIIHQDILSVGSNVYSFGHLYGSNWRPTALVYNRSLLEREGQPDIYDLWTSGNWTWEEAEKIIQNVTRDTDGDGEIDQWGIAWRRIDYAIYMNNAQFVKKDADGKYRYGWADDDAIWVFDKIAEWYREGYIVPKELDGSNRIKNGTVAMQFGSDHAEGGQANNGDTLIYAPIPMGPHADRHIYPEWAVKFASIPVTAENPEGLIALHDFLFRKEDFDFDSWFATEVNERMFNRESAEHLLYALENWQGDVEWVNGLDSPDVNIRFSDDMDPLFRGIEPVRSYLEAKGPTAQAQIDALFGQ